MATTREEAKKEVQERRKKNMKNMKDNSSLYAGSPMYYYCQYCCAHTDTLSESDFTTKPKTICKDCKPLKNKGLL